MTYKKKVSYLIPSLLFLVSCWVESDQLSYKECIVAVESPISDSGFGSKGADWIAIYMIQDNINNNRGIRHLPGLIRVNDDGFYFYFYETCRDKLKWSKYYVEKYLEMNRGDYYYQLNPLSSEEVDHLGIRKIIKY